MSKRHPQYDETYEYNSTVVCTTLYKGEEEFSFNREDKIFLDFNGEQLPIIPGIFEPKRDDKVRVSGEYPDGSYTLECDDIIRFADDGVIDRTVVCEVLREIGIEASSFDAETIFQIMSVWPPNVTVECNWTPEDYLNKLLECINGYLKPYAGSPNGAYRWGIYQKQLFSIMFGFEVANFIEKAVDHEESFKLYATIETKGKNRYIALYVNNESIYDFMERYGIVLRGLTFSLPFVSDQHQDDCKKEWWRTPYHKAWHNEHDKNIANGSNNTNVEASENKAESNMSSGLSMLLGAANISSTQSSQDTPEGTNEVAKREGLSDIHYEEKSYVDMNWSIGGMRNTAEIIISKVKEMETKGM